MWISQPFSLCKDLGTIIQLVSKRFKKMVVEELVKVNRVSKNQPIFRCEVYVLFNWMIPNLKKKLFHQMSIKQCVLEFQVVVSIPEAFHTSLPSLPKT